MKNNLFFFNLRFIDYNPTSLESTHRHELLTEHDLGIHVDIILPDAYAQVIFCIVCAMYI